jgi:triosephosphate isomerase
MPRPKIIAGNWKMNGTPAESEKLLKAILKGYKPRKGVVAVVCPPFTSLATTAKIIKYRKIHLGAQDVSEYTDGAFTGDISAKMLKSIGVKYVIVGHSERRQFHSETDQKVNAKARKALETGLIPIICIGETLKERETKMTEAVVSQQLDGALADLKEADMKKVVFAYEPIWAIGTGRTASPEMAQEVHKFIRNKLELVKPSIAASVPIIYGGSVKPDNAPGLLNQPDIDGALIGGASLDAKSFISILRTA